MNMATKGKVGGEGLWNYFMYIKQNPKYPVVSTKMVCPSRSDRR